MVILTLGLVAELWVGNKNCRQSDDTHNSTLLPSWDERHGKEEVVAFARDV